MIIKQIYTGCLAQGAYYIESEGEVAIIDPLREVRPYIEMAEAKGAKIKYILETHFHADFVSGHVTLSEKTGADIVFGPNASTSFRSIIAKDGQEFKLGSLTIVALHTPGHTMESTTYLLRDAQGRDTALFTGDTLFLGDVGRPDLAQKAADITQEELAGILYDSLRTKIMPLADDITVYPAHGAGSACGKNMSKETVGSLGDQKATNYALRADMTKEEFIKEVTAGLLPPPAYFPLNVKMNKEGYASIDEVIKKGDVALSPNAFETAANETGAVMLDVRHQDKFVVEHVPNSIFIGIKGGFAPWVGALIKDVEQPILLIVDAEDVEEVITRLSRVGFDNVLGYLEGGLTSWKAAGKEVESLESIKAEQFAAQVETDGRKIFDVRKPGEWDAEHLEGAEHASLDELNSHLAEFPKEDKFYIHCAGGYRSVIAASILKSRGIHNMIDVKGGFGAIKKTELKTSAFVCPNS
ncbi:MAG: rhodanese-like domain-containing protein [Flavobacteriales bacterium]